MAASAGRTFKVIQPPSEKDIGAYIQKRPRGMDRGAMRAEIESLIEKASVM